MKLRIISALKVRQKFVLDGEAEYLKRMKKLGDIELVEIGSKDSSSSIPAAELMKKEAQAFSTRIKEGDFVVALDEHGKEMTSHEFAALLQEQMNRATPAVSFILGGAFGIDPDLKKRARLTISLSRLTFPYQLCRLVLVEQIYRAFTIIRGIPYHK